ncbi:MAG: ribulose-phosphate 3-epimerase [Lachnospiraceae bacterium]|nr:ribulose-phosphate 3-epimerase [Lachnospiraceae bacterium]
MSLYRGKSGYILSPSVLSADFSKLGEDVKAIAKTPWVHLDVMDGAFVPNISFGPDVIKSVRGISKQIFDTHLMVNEPIRYIKNFVDAGADSISIHVEACEDVKATLDAVKSYNIMSSIAINPETPIEEIYPYLEMVDMVLVMSVHPGFGGQSFIEDTFDKLDTLSNKLVSLGLDDKVDIEVDGGVSLKNVDKVIEAGANIIVAGSGVYKGDIDENIVGFDSVFSRY